MSDNRELDRLANVRLASGAHDSWEQGACLMEAVAYVAGEPHSDHPQCASPVLGAFGCNLNDGLPDDLRQHLKPLVPLLIGTAGDGHDEARSYLALDWLIRTYLPTWLRVGGLTEQADAVAALAPIVDLDSAQTAEPVVHAAGAAARAAAGAAARAAAGAAARVTAWVTAWVTAGAAVGVTAGVTAGAAVGVAAGAAVGAALAPTVRELQLSAIELFGRMITVGSSTEPTIVAPVETASAAELGV